MALIVHCASLWLSRAPLSPLRNGCSFPLGPRQIPLPPPPALRRNGPGWRRAILPFPARWRPSSDWSHVSGFLARAGGGGFGLSPGVRRRLFEEFFIAGASGGPLDQVAQKRSFAGYRQWFIHKGER